jgi:hypothetical protein
MIPTAYRRNARGLRDRQAFEVEFEVEFESPDPAAASPSGLLPTRRCHRGRASPSTRAGNRYLQVRASSFSPAVRSRAVCSGQSRSLETTVALGSGSLTWGGGGGRNCMACKGSGVQIPQLHQAIHLPRSQRRLPANDAQWPPNAVGVAKVVAGRGPPRPSPGPPPGAPRPRPAGGWPSPGVVCQ